MDHDPVRPTERFSKSIDYYHKYRPRYPYEVIDIIQKECGADINSEIADVGSGTGILTEQLLSIGCPVYGIEPNREMRECAQENLKKFSNFKSINGTAENLTIMDESVDIITVAQAFHWFEPTSVKKEFRRVLRNSGWVIMLWNFRSHHMSPTMQAYEKLLTNYGTDYKKVAAENISELEVKRFFAPNSFKTHIFENIQKLDLKGLQGRLLSTSYTPKPGDFQFEEMLAETKKIFDEYQDNGYVQVVYNSTVYYGQLN